MKVPSHPQAKLPVPGRYRHYKGRDYEVLGIAKHSETQESLVVYRCLYGDFSLWVRPLAMFQESVELAGESVPRFVLVEAYDGPPQQSSYNDRKH